MWQNLLYPLIHNPTYSNSHQPTSHCPFILFHSHSRSLPSFLDFFYNYNSVTVCFLLVFLFCPGYMYKSNSNHIHLTQCIVLISYRHFIQNNLNSIHELDSQACSFCTLRHLTNKYHNHLSFQHNITSYLWFLTIKQLNCYSHLIHHYIHILHNSEWFKCAYDYNNKIKHSFIVFALCQLLS